MTKPEAKLRILPAESRIVVYPSTAPDAPPSSPPAPTAEASL
jgi:hypothetical protein